MKKEGNKYSRVLESHVKTVACVVPGAFPGVYHM